MQTKYWVLLLALVLALCLGVGLLLLPGDPARYAQVYAEGRLLYNLDLSTDTEVTVTTQAGTNVITVRDGKVAVTQADCPDGYCMDRGFCSSGLQIVCLPHRLVIKFVGNQDVDIVS